MLSRVGLGSVVWAIVDDIHNETILHAGPAY